MKFEEKLNHYAQLLVIHGLNVQPGQLVQISAAAYHRDLACKVAQVAYEKGAKFVQVDLLDDRLAKLRLTRSCDEALKFVPRFVQEKYRELVDEEAASLSIVGPEDPDLLTDVDPKKMNICQSARRQAIKVFYEEGIGKSKVQWTVAAAATPLWGKKVFPKETPQKAEELLWDSLFKLCRVDRPDFLEEWKRHNTLLHTRGKKLTDMQIKELHFTGPGTDLVVGLSSKACWQGGTDKSSRGVEFEPNLPTEECFSTPDYRATRGKVRATRPFFVYGTLVKDLEMEFKSGEIVHFTAKEGSETFREYINTDPGAKRLGEVALVGIDSPIFQSGLLFSEILLDENAACHIAIGRAYDFCLKGGPHMTPEEKDALGCNDSLTHTDMMISNEQVDVHATTYNGQTLKIISKGAWVSF